MTSAALGVGTMYHLCFFHDRLYLQFGINTKAYKIIMKEYQLLPKLSKIFKTLSKNSIPQYKLKLKCILILERLILMS